MPQRNRGRFAPFVLGTALTAFALVLALFALGALWAGDDPWGLLLTGGVAALLGVPLLWVGQAGSEPTRREALIAVLSLWLLMPLVGSIPYIASAGLTPLNALFESMSGFTATGATVIVNFDQVPASIFLYRAFSQWIGGIGILVLFIAVFPQLAIAGRQLFHTEMPGPTEERLAPRMRSTAAIVLGVYLTLSLIAALSYRLAGMPLFEAIAHAFTTVAAAGFSPQARSFEGYGAAVDWVAVVFMTLAAVNFALLWRAVGGRPRELLRDREFRAYLAIVLVVAGLVSLQVAALYEPGEAIRHSLFQVVSILTTTGYASVDFNTWPDAARALLVALMFIGGSAGSAAGGVKIARWLIMVRHTGREVRRVLHPRAVLPLRVGERPLGEEVVRAVAAFIALYTMLLGFSAVVLAWLGADLTSAFTAAAATLGNVGPALGLAGPMSSYAEFHPIGQGLLIFNMYAGRLEVVTVFVLATSAWWKVPRGMWRGGGSRGG